MSTGGCGGRGRCGLHDWSASASGCDSGRVVDSHAIGKDQMGPPIHKFYGRVSTLAFVAFYEVNLVYVE